jgi:hypothetical protein
MVGITQQDVSRFLRYCVLSPNGTAAEWSRDYIRFLMGQIFVRRGWEGLAVACGEEPFQKTGNTI